MAAAELIDQEGEELPQTNHEAEVLSDAIPEPVTDSLAEFAVPSEEQPEEDDIPDKYRGKSIKEIAAMHQEAEKLIGKQGSEVGELRKVVDQYITAQLQSNSAQAQEPEEEIDFFEDPDKAVERAIERHPSVQQAAQTAKQYQQQTAVAVLSQKHPDMQQVLSDPKFAEWVGGSEVRKAMFVEADQRYNTDLADELISLYKERAGVAQQAAQVEQQSRKQQIKAASTGTGASASQGGTGKRIYRRADIIKLMKNDPERYDAISGELMEAYREGRVR
jgi:predicted RNA-binding protein YlqC (UPF0109 family)